MSFTSIRQALTAAVVAVLVSACGGSGSSAPPPTGGITVTPGDGTATVTWTATPGVKYWLFYAPSSTISSVDWINIPGSRAILDVTSPYVLTGLANGYTYSFTVNGRNGDGPGGPGAPTVSIIPRPAGATWSSGSSMGANTLRSIAYGISTADALGYYVSFGDAGSTYRSTNGITWNAIAPCCQHPTQCSRLHLEQVHRRWGWWKNCLWHRSGGLEYCQRKHHREPQCHREQRSHGGRRWQQWHPACIG
jgi:hypothetical protein